MLDDFVERVLASTCAQCCTSACTVGIWSFLSRNSWKIFLQSEIDEILNIDLYMSSDNQIDITVKRSLLKL